MPTNRRYPKIYIRSKNDLTKHLVHKGFSQPEALVLVNDVIKNFDKHWRDNIKESDPIKGKYVRNAKGTSLGKLLDHINKQVLAPCDSLLPNFIFGGVGGLNHVQAVQYLEGKKHKRVLLKIDIKGFFEQIGRDRVYYFFKTKSMCSPVAAKLLSDFCCVPIGKKDSGNEQKTIGRGFATSSRLAVWCNLDVFIKIDRLVKKRLKGKDPRVAIYVDDIGITASGVSKEEMKKLAVEIEKILNSDENQKLPVNHDKTKIISHEEGIEHLGLRPGRKKLAIGSRSRSRMTKIKNKLGDQNLSVYEKKKTRSRYKSFLNYRGYVEKQEYNR